MTGGMLGTRKWEHCGSSVKNGVWVWEIPPSPRRACNIHSVLSPGRYRVPKSLAMFSFQKLFLMLPPIS